MVPPAPDSSGPWYTALYRRLHWLRVLLGWRPLRYLLWSVFGLWLAFAVLVTALRFVVLPQIGRYQPQIEQMASQALGREVRIGRLETRWRGLNPDLVMNEFHIHDTAGQPVLTLNQVDAVLSWNTLWRGRLMLSLLAVDGPVLHIRRETDGRFSVAGFESADDTSDPAALRWLLAQSRIRIRNATLVWEDRLRAAPPLILEDLQFALDNQGRRHRIGLSAIPPEALANRLELRGEFLGDPDEALDRLAGRAFLELDYADLAGWHAWLDYPVDLVRGRGAVRLWADHLAGQSELTADLALEDVRLRARSDLPWLDLVSLRGRLQGRYAADAWSFTGRKLELMTRDGVRLSPNDLHVDWQQARGSSQVVGHASANLLDVGALVRLAGHLPLDDGSRHLLTTYQPSGRLDELRASWKLDGQVLREYSLKTGFRQLQLTAAGRIPGARGLSGEVEATEQGGRVRVDSSDAQIDLPAVFQVPEIALSRLLAQVQWKHESRGLAIKLEKVDFAGPDADGSAQGDYLFTGEGPGVIDLQAHIARADARAVWRYLPLVVDQAARDWLRRGLVAGTASDGKLVLKGDLRDFPFRDPAKGSFLVTAKAHGVTVDYADGWPAISGISGDMRFNHGMRVETTQGAILGARLGRVVTEIPDFDNGPLTVLKVRGEASGPTSEFLKFIVQSPVSEKIDRFTEGMSASGSGRLDLGLEIPLQKVEASRVSGDYAFQNNQVQVVKGLPPITQVNGHLKLTESSVLADDLSGRLFGGSLRLKVRNEADKVSVLATGQATASALREHFAWPGMSALGGSANWRTEINIRKRQADFRIDSDLLGITSALPAPFAKTATQPLPLRLERTPGSAGQETWALTLGKLARGLITLPAEGSGIERGVIAVGGEGELRPPAQGLLVLLQQPAVDGDAWRQVFASESRPAARNDATAVPALTLQLRTAKLRLMERDYENVDLSLKPREGGWLIGLNMKEALGELLWRSAGDGFVEGRLKRLIVRKPMESASTPAQSSVIDGLPGMNLTVDELTVSDKLLGQLEVKARNLSGRWQLDTLQLRNPDGVLKGSGQWQKAPSLQTALDFELSSNNVGKLLERLGYGEVVRRGTANLSGKVSWQGPLVAIDFPSLTGALKVDAEKGQFNKLEPGVGKLLGLISLQSLPRRLTLDFRDIFSDGLAFDSIESRLDIQRGVMRTAEPLLIKGPAAQIRIEGLADLRNETQDLAVEVRPELSTAATVGAALVNPVAGAAALVVSSVLPINRLFSYRYHVTGSWNDPQVAKDGNTPAAATPSDKPASTKEGRP